jgi:O-antigen/teichoic acid export membrane protein
LLCERGSFSTLMIRNVIYLLGGNVVSWVIGLLFWLVIPRAIGPVAWGELNLGWAIAGVAFAVGSLGIPTFLVKEMSRDRAHRSEYLGAGLATQLPLSLGIAAVIFLFTLAAGYGPHTRAVILLVAGILMCSFFAYPPISALQALEKMHINSVILGVRQVAATSVAVLIELVLRVDVIVLVTFVLAFNALATVLQLVVTHRYIPIKPVFNRGLSWRLITRGLPFWSNGVFLIIYVWIDSVLLSMLASTREVGYYAAPTQVIQAVGFLPAIVTTVVFPALSSSFHTDIERLRRLTRVSLSILISLGLPISVGMALVGPKAVLLLFGPAFRASGPAIVVLALTVVPSYIATLAYWVLAAMDRERLWAYVMGSMAVVNPLLNLFTIPYFQSRFGHGSLGAAWALLITDWTVCVAGIVLMAPVWLKSAVPILGIIARVALATAAMAVPVWFLRDQFLPIPILVGIGVFAGAALVLGVFRGDGYAEAWAALRLRLRQRFRQRPEAVNVPTA